MISATDPKRVKKKLLCMYLKIEEKVRQDVNNGQIQVKGSRMFIVPFFQLSVY